MYIKFYWPDYSARIFTHKKNYNGLLFPSAFLNFSFETGMIEIIVDICFSSQKIYTFRDVYLVSSVVSKMVNAM